MLAFFSCHAWLSWCSFWGHRSFGVLMGRPRDLLSQMHAPRGVSCIRLGGTGRAWGRGPGTALVSGAWGRMLPLCDPQPCSMAGCTTSQTAPREAETWLWKHHWGECSWNTLLGWAWRLKSHRTHWAWRNEEAGKPEVNVPRTGFLVRSPGLWRPSCFDKVESKGAQVSFLLCVFRPFGGCLCDL